VLQWILNKISVTVEISEDHQKVRDQLQGIDFSGIDATLLPVKTVGVQGKKSEKKVRIREIGDSRSYQYVVGLSGTKNWDLLFRLARIIPQVGDYK
jgi:hypothetical protein